MHDLLLALWQETGMTIFMVTHDIAEAFKLGTRLLANAYWQFGSASAAQGGRAPPSSLGG
jgi:ABC-type nitrate/sulfonate/bicarbonate transport system ATPase subunit